MSEPTAPAASAKKSKKPLVLILGGVLVLGGLGGGAFWYTRRAPAGEAAHVKPPERGILAFEPFVANLADPGASRFLRTTVQLIVPLEMPRSVPSSSSKTAAFTLPALPVPSSAAAIAGPL